jgi:prepilin peptidase CpaA
LTLGPPEVVLLVGLAVAAITDARTGRIPNALTGLLMALGVLWWVTQGEPMVGIVGLLAAFALHFVLWKLGVEKAGDAKLFMAIGAGLGWGEMIEASLYTGVVYLPVGLLLLAVQGRLPNLVAAVRYTALKAQGLDPGDPPEPTMLRTAPIIAVGGAVAIFTDWVSIG